MFQLFVLQLHDDRSKFVGYNCVGSWENRADVAGLAFELGRLKVKKKYDNFFF